jgi:hypothetical protein
VTLRQRPDQVAAEEAGAAKIAISVSFWAWRVIDARSWL